MEGSGTRSTFAEKAGIVDAATGMDQTTKDSVGFNPDVPDKTIHEFPCYSFVLGDLHAHVVNIMFVLLLLGLLYAWTKKVRNTTPSVEKLGRRKFWMKQLLMPQILAAAMLLGMFHWTNYWDFVIYYVVTGGTLLFMNIICLKGDIRRIFVETCNDAIELCRTEVLELEQKLKKGEALRDHLQIW